MCANSFAKKAEDATLMACLSSKVFPVRYLEKGWKMREIVLEILHLFVIEIVSSTVNKLVESCSVSFTSF